MLEALLAGFLLLDLGLIFTALEQMVKAAPTETGDNDPLPPTSDQDWEYKIVQVRGGAFRSWRAIQYVCQQEAKFGWTLMEKLDDNRLRLKRPIACRAKDSCLKQNPYRTNYGLSGDFMMFLSVLATLMILAIPAYVGYAFTRRIFEDLETQSPRQIQAPAPRKPTGETNKP
ncbi:MAG: hypothetical protein RMK91_04055 [Pseudanabaenaceae cyanobacterium SKYGB_i_bin29]|nr:hypothetical protein [Pseudanabaenaceae cyanobacterium SKYG29]MDW8421017.1 hypothetical protein [Pseudanabaenaceae cyanobacterium SKYGB_i_bin29]